MKCYIHPYICELKGVFQSIARMTVHTTPQAVPLIINGEDITTKSTFGITNPKTGQEVWQSSSASVTDAVKAVETAQAALPTWSKTKPAVRRDIFLRAAELFKKRETELRQYQIEETGADEKFIDWILPLTIELLKDVAGRVTSIQGSVPLTAEEGRSAIIYKESYLRLEVQSPMGYQGLGVKPRPRHARLSRQLSRMSL